jgi:signal transduction histidine kinase
VTPFARNSDHASGTLELPGLIARLQPTTLLHQAAAACAFLIAYVALEWISFIHEYKNVPITPWNPGLGVVFALMVLGGPAYAAVLFAGVVIAETTVLQTNLQWPIILGIAAIFAVVYGAAAAVARKYVWLDTSIRHLRDVFVLLATGLAGAALVALLLCALLLFTGQLGRGDVLVAAVPLLVGDVIGIAVMTPLLLRVMGGRRESPIAYLRVHAIEALLYVALIAASLWIIVEAGTDDGFKFFYLLFVPVMVAAVRYGFDGACIALAFTQLGLVGVLHVFDTDARAFTEFQTLMLVLTGTGLIVGAVVSERQNADLLVREAEARLREKEAEAAQAARFSLVSGMASALAHEINQPMTAARALARSAQHIMGMPAPDLVRAANNLTTLIAHIDHAGSVVGHMRDFLRRGRPHVSTVDLRSLLDDTMPLAGVEAAAHGVTIELAAGDVLPPVHGDRVQLQQVILNLVHNAIEAITAARQPDGRVRISAVRRDAPARVEIAVADNGPGIGKDLADRLFAPLTTSKSEGLGLGLSICAAIAESHGGRVWLHSAAAGATEFRFSLPLNATAAP